MCFGAKLPKSRCQTNKVDGLPWPLFIIADFILTSEGIEAAIYVVRTFLIEPTPSPRVMCSEAFCIDVHCSLARRLKRFDKHQLSLLMPIIIRVQVTTRTEYAARLTNYDFHAV